MKKLSRKARKFVDEVENRKNYISYHSVKLYGATDIPLPPNALPPSNILVPPSKLWEDFDPCGEPFLAEKLEEAGNFARYSFLAASYPDGNLTAELSVRSPSYYARKAVLLVGDKDALPQTEVVDTIVEKTGAYVFVVDYNGLREGGATVFPPSLSYGKHGCENGRLDALPEGKDASAKDTCPYLYVLILRRAVAFIKHNFPRVDLIVTGIRYGVELAMAVAGSEKTDVSALGCLCGCGYPQYADVPKYPHAQDDFTNEQMGFIVSLSGVSYVKNYPHPVFVGVGSNGTYSDVDRLSALKSLISAPLTLAITSQFADSIDAEAFRQYLLWLDQSFYRSDFPAAPVTTIDVNRDGTVYADVSATATPSVRSATLYYSYGDANHKTRLWSEVACETVGVGQYLAKMTFTRPCDFLYYYTVATYCNGLVATEAPKFLDVSTYRIALLPAKSNVVLFRYGAEGWLTGESGDAVITERLVQERVAPSGVKGAANDNGSMKLFVKEACASMGAERLLQVDSFKSEAYYSLSLEVAVGTTPVTYYRATKTVSSVGNFTSTRFAASDFKDERFSPLASWQAVNTLSVLTEGVVINKIMFI